MKVLTAIAVAMHLVTPHTVTLDWIASVSNGVRGYRVFKSANSGPFKQIAGGVKGTEYIDKGVYRGKTYTYYLESVSSTGIASVPSEQVTVTIP